MLLAATLAQACEPKVPAGPGVVTITENTRVLGVTVTPASATMDAGDRMTFAATVTAQAGVTDRTVTWTSSNPAIASVDANGVVTAGTTAGTATIRATSKADTAISAAAAVTVRNSSPLPITNFSVILNVASDPGVHEPSTGYTSVTQIPSSKGQTVCWSSQATAPMSGRPAR